MEKDLGLILAFIQMYFDDCHIKRLEYAVETYSAGLRASEALKRVNDEYEKAFEEGYERRKEEEWRDD